MTKLLPICISAVFLAIITDKASVYEWGYWDEKVYLYKNKVFYIIMTVAMSLFVGLRTSYNDTSAYIKAYEASGTGFHAIQQVDLAIGNNPGFKILCIIFKSIGFQTQTFLMIFGNCSGGNPIGVSIST